MIDRDAVAPGDADRRRRGSGGLVVLLVALAVLSGVLTYGLYRVLASDTVAEYDALASHGSRASGTVVDAEVSSSLLPFVGPGGVVVYRFSAGDDVFEGRGESGPPNPPVSRLAPGQVLQVTYDVRDPTRSCLCDPGARARHARTTMLAAGGITAVVVPLVGGLAAAWAGRRRDEP